MRRDRFLVEFVYSPQVVHSDLAARNVLVFPNHLVKITDFGLSRRLYLNPHYMGKPNVNKFLKLEKGVMLITVLIVGYDSMEVVSH